MKKILNIFINYLGKKNYSIDSNIKFYDLCIIIVKRIRFYLRGLIFYKLFFRESGIFFIGKNVCIEHCKNISLGSNVLIDNNVNISGLCRNGIKIGNNVTLKPNTVIDSGLISNIGDGIRIGNNVGISQNCFLQASATLTIENNVIIGPGTSIFTENHNFSDQEKFINEQGVDRMAVTIKEGAWIGSGVTILSGVEIGRNSVIGAGSLVNSSVADNSIAVGRPARTIKTREQS